MRTRPAILVVATSMLLGQLPTDVPTALAAGQTGEVLVALTTGAGTSIRRAARQLGVTPIEVYVTSRAFTARVSHQQAQRLADDPRVEGVIDDDLLAGIAGIDDADS